tara:strand:- start:321 stop:1058 length:738 start_codon:yes stop_codon:yes gene_type:complete
MSNNPYQIGDVQYWKDGSATRFDSNSLAFKKKVYGSYSRTSIMSDKDSQKSGIQLILSPNDVTISKSDALTEKSRIDSFEGYFNSQFGKSGTWSSRNSRQQSAQAYRRLEDIDNRKNIINSILENPVNIARWANEERLIQEEEEERLLQIELEKKRIQDEIKRKETSRLLELENQKRNKIILEKDILFQLSREKKSVIPVVIPIIKPATIPEIDPAVLPSIVATSSLIPLGVLAILLINSSRGKK